MTGQRAYLMKKQTKKYTIGIQLTSLDSPYEKKIYSSIESTAEKIGLNLIFFPGKELHSPNRYDFQYNTIYSLISAKCLDGLIVSAGSVSSRITGPDFKKEYLFPHKIPVICLGMLIDEYTSVTVDNRTGMKELIDHLIDDHNNRHFAFIKGREHNYDSIKRLALFNEFLTEKGLPPDPSCIIPGEFDEKATKRELLQLLHRHPEIDTIIAANDEMAIWACEELENLGKTGTVTVSGFNDITESRYTRPALTTISLPLAECGRIAVKYMAKLLAKEEVPRQTILPTHLVVRESCGCSGPDAGRICTSDKVKQLPLTEAVLNVLFSSYPSIELTGRDLPKKIKQVLTPIDLSITAAADEELFLKYVRKMIEDETLKGRGLSVWERMLQILWRVQNERKAYTNTENVLSDKTFLSAEFIVTSRIQMQNERRAYLVNRHKRLFHTFLQKLSSTLFLEELIELLKEGLPELGIRTCYMSLFTVPFEHRAYNSYTPPEESLLILAYTDKREIISGFSRETFHTDEFIPQKYLPENRRASLVVYPLFFRNEQYGFIIMEAAGFASELYETLARQIATALKSSNLFSETRSKDHRLLNTLRELENSRKKIEMLSNTDEMTGLLNRRGFLNLARQNVDLCNRMGLRGYLIFCDINNLKLVNEKMGREEGNNTLKLITSVLTVSFRSVDVIARLGDDEFAVLAIGVTDETIQMIRDRINSHIALLNKREKKPYTISLSIGGIPFGSGYPVMPVEQLVSEADKNMFFDKQLRKDLENM